MAAHGAQVGGIEADGYLVFSRSNAFGDPMLHFRVLLRPCLCLQ